jgi:hypothetical protein
MAGCRLTDAGRRPAAACRRAAMAREAPRYGITDKRAKPRPRDRGEGRPDMSDEAKAAASRARQAERNAKADSNAEDRNYNKLQRAFRGLEDPAKEERLSVSRVLNAIQMQNKQLGGYIRQLVRLVRLAHFCTGRKGYDTFFYRDLLPRTPGYFLGRIRKALEAGYIPDGVIRIGSDEGKAYIEFVEPAMGVPSGPGGEPATFRVSAANIPPAAILLQVMTDTLGPRMLSAFFAPILTETPAHSAEAVARTLRSAFTKWLSEALSTGRVARQAFELGRFLAKQKEKQEKQKDTNWVWDEIIFAFWLAQASMQDPDSDQATAAGRAQSGESVDKLLPLGPRMRQRICQSVRKLHKSQRLAANTKIMPDAPLPEDVTLGPLHPELVARVPEIAAYHAALIDNTGVVLAEPGSRKVAGWVTEPEGLGFTRYLNAAQAMLRFRRALQVWESREKEAVDDEASYGGRWDVQDDDQPDGPGAAVDEWQSPIVVLSTSPCDSVKWLMKKDLKQLQHYLFGCVRAAKKEPSEPPDHSDSMSIPDAGTSYHAAIRSIYFKLANLDEDGDCALMGKDRFDLDNFTRTLLRADVFGGVQSRITQSLRESETGLIGVETIRAALAGGSYEDTRQRYWEIPYGVQKTMLASIKHFIELETPLSEEAERALVTLLVKVADPDVLQGLMRLGTASGLSHIETLIAGLKRAYAEVDKADIETFVGWVRQAATERQGFEANDRKNDDVRKAHAAAAPALVHLAEELDDLVKHLERFGRNHPAGFSEDFEKFASAFRTIYVDVEAPQPD